MRSKILSLMLLVVAVALPGHGAMAQTELDVNLIQPDAEFGKYSKFLIRPLEIDETVLIPPPWIEGKSGKPRPWNISKKNAEFLQKQYHGAMENQLQKLGGYALVDEADSDVLTIEIEIISLTPWAKKGDKVITKGSGEMTFRAEIRDSMTRDLLAVFEGETPVGDDYQEHTEFTVDQNVEALFNHWGEFLREGLDRQRSAAG